MFCHAKKYVLPVFIFTLCNTISAQNDSAQVKNKASIRDIYIMTGFAVQLNGSASKQDFKTLAPPSPVFSRNLYGFSESKGFKFVAGPVFSASAGFNFPNKIKTYYRPNPQLRIGFSWLKISYLTLDMHKKDSKPIDTLVTGQLYYRDSVFLSDYRMNYVAEQVRLDAALLFRTNRMKRLSLYAGAGFAVGMSLSSRTDIVFKYTTYIETTSPGSKVKSNKKEQITIETYHNRNGFTYLFYIPMGVDLRLGKRRESWKKINFFMELRPVITYTVIPELRKITTAGLINTWGLRIALY